MRQTNFLLPMFFNNTLFQRFCGFFWDTLYMQLANMLIPSGASITMATPLGVDLSCVVGHEPADTVCVCFPSRERVQTASVSYLVTPRPIA